MPNYNYYNIDTANDIIARDPHVTIMYTYIIYIQLPYTLNTVTRYTMVLILDILRGRAENLFAPARYVLMVRETETLSIH